MWQSLAEAVFSFSVSKRKIILWFFLILYAFLTIIILFALRTAVTGSNYLFLYPQAILSGKISLVVFCLVMIPGITRRFGIRNKLVFPLMMYRRYLGISMFLLAMFHATVVRFASFVEEGLPFKNLLWFEITGVNSNLATAIRTVVILLFAWGIVFAQGTFKDLGSISRYSMIFLVLSGIATGISWLFYFRALQLGNASQVAPIDKLSLVFTIILAAIFLKEKLSFQVALGAILMSLGAILITLAK